MAQTVYLKDLCEYYLDCLRQENSNEVSLPLYKSVPQYMLLNGISKESFLTENVSAFINQVAQTKQYQFYLGYPILIHQEKDNKGKWVKHVLPVFSFPIQIQSSLIEVVPEPSLNLAVFKAFHTGITDSLIDDWMSLESELGIDGNDNLPDVNDLVKQLQKIREWNWKEEIDPALIPRDRDVLELKDGIYNQPIVFVSEEGIYTAGLIQELTKISKLPPSRWEGTALYKWVCQEKKETEGSDNLLEILPLNREQRIAVRKALHSDVTIITGPPGTGKSQVVTDLLANISRSGKMALFSSKNHKAVDVVVERMNQLNDTPALLKLDNKLQDMSESVKQMLAFVPGAGDAVELRANEMEYSWLISQISGLQAERERIIDLRNKTDLLEEKYSNVRHLMKPYFSSIEKAEADHLMNSLEAYQLSHRLTKRQNNPLFTRLIWPFMRSRKRTECMEAALKYNAIAGKFSLPRATADLTEVQVQEATAKVREFCDAVPITCEYRESLLKLKQAGEPGKADQALAALYEKQVQLAKKVWKQWQNHETGRLTDDDRMKLTNFMLGIKGAGDGFVWNKKIKDSAEEVEKILGKCGKNWAVTSLSARGRIPFVPGFFDYLIIDEASQCDIASALPLLFRAKQVIIIGDPNQLNPIYRMKEEQDNKLLEERHILPAWGYTKNSLYGVAVALFGSNSKILLRDHFRSNEDIIGFSNKEYYSESLRIRTKTELIPVPQNKDQDLKGIIWDDCSGPITDPPTGSEYNDKEIDRIIRLLCRLDELDYKGTIGVTTPFRAQADRIYEKLCARYKALYDKLKDNNQLLIRTIHGFQGDERDTIIFSTVVSDETPASKLKFLMRTGNLFNVAITRARGLLLVVGNKDYCKKCDVPYLKRFALYCDDIQSRGEPVPLTLPIGREYPKVDNPDQVSEWEKTLYSALYERGIETIPQYPVDKYKLDLAVILENGAKLDIEIDGEMYHNQWNGDLSYRDQIRNQRLMELGWDVKRFWVCQIRDETGWCIEQIEKWKGKKEKIESE